MQLVRTLNVGIDNKGEKTTFPINFPLEDGSILIRGADPSFFSFGVTYSKNRMLTGHNADFLKEDTFINAAEKAAQTLTIRKNHTPYDTHNWNIYIGCWAASHAKNLPGDFVECGVNTGMLSMAVVEYIDFNSTGKTFFLCDTFTGIPEGQVSEEENKFYSDIGVNAAVANNAEKYSEDIFSQVKTQFSGYNVKVIQGKVPDTLDQVDTEEVCYLSIDMNITMPEIAAAEHFWEKMVPGGVIVLDDYGWYWHLPQKRAFDEFAEKRSVKVLSLPTGQGLIFKP